MARLWYIRPEPFYFIWSRRKTYEHNFISIRIYSTTKRSRLVCRWIKQYRITLWHTPTYYWTYYRCDGTSLPEAFVSITAALKSNAAITIGNVVGSNILNVGIILGITALIRPLHIQNSTIKYEMPFMSL